MSHAGAVVALAGGDALGLVQAHLGWLRWRNLSEGTIEQRRLTLARLRRFHNGRDVTTMTAADILAFRDRLTRAGRPLAVESQAAELAHLRSFYRWLVLEEHRVDDPTIKVPRPKLPRRLPRPIAEWELRRAVDTAPERVRPWLLLAAFAGLRACEIAPLRAEDLWWHAAPALIIIRRAKGGDEQAVPMAPQLVDELRRLPSRGWLFPKRDGMFGPVKAHSVSQLCNNHLHSLGIWDTLHSLRHRFGTQVLRASGGDLRQTQELMRHASPVTTAGYTQIDLHDAATTVAALPDVS